MKWISSTELLIQTNLSAAEVRQKISEITEPKKTFRFLVGGVQEKIVFEGTVSEKEFYLERLVKASIPIRGKIESLGELTLVKVSMRVSGFTLLWFMIVFVFCSSIVVSLLKSFENTPIDFAPFLIPIGFFSFCLLLTILRFNREVKKTKTIFSQILIKEKHKGAR